MAKRIAVIGGGAAGLSCAWSLGRVHDVVVFEKEAHLGGHAYSELVEIGGRSVSVDMGVEFFSERQAPNLFLLLERLQIPTYVAPLSFVAHFADKSWSNTGSGALWPLIRDECSRFQIQMHRIMQGEHPPVKGLSIGTFLKQQGYSGSFAKSALFPLLTTFSSCHAPVEAYNLMFCAMAFGMGLLSFFHPSYWRKVSAGIGSYIQALAKDFRGVIHCGAMIDCIQRGDKGVTVCLKDQAQQQFDEVIFATHADQALQLLEAPTPKEHALLSAFTYTTLQSVLHTKSAVGQGNSGPSGYLEYREADHQRGVL